ncbi:MAG: hypothetical protein ACXAEU_25590 [Candidatus Hodarchaeales archaeon]|jgi:hypothetical protein
MVIGILKLQVDKLAKENRRQREMDYYKKSPFGNTGEEKPFRCIHCPSPFLTVIKKLPRTFKCSKGYVFTIVEFRELIYKKP